MCTKAGEISQEENLPRENSGLKIILIVQVIIKNVKYKK